MVTTLLHALHAVRAAGIIILIMALRHVTTQCLDLYERVSTACAFQNTDFQRRFTRHDSFTTAPRASARK